jgi:nucleotide-binding universal stress UspA family protein
MKPFKFVQVRGFKNYQKTNMTNGIVSVTDFSDSSRETVRWAIDLAKRLDSHLTILYTYRLFKQEGEAVPLKRRMEEEASKKFTELESQLLAGSGIEYDFKTEVGFVDDRITEYVKHNKLSFLVMGKVGARNNETFDGLLKSLQVPLVIVP